MMKSQALYPRRLGFKLCDNIFLSRHRKNRSARKRVSEEGAGLRAGEEGGGGKGDPIRSCLLN